ncbi:glycosyl hydrolase 108 family protein [Fodinicurvata sp. EGI_FJ10296]|uniref:glycoside hydrolase family 108 protein n=1 Tax=Fodinicurvata sp. EGI_FJ10296 TaxID=3231908 RepID=UPI0034566577
MTPFDSALAFVLDHEGGFVNHPEDPGGATNQGITLATFRRWARRHGHHTPTVDELKAIPGATVRAIYRDDYWQALLGDELTPAVALITFDMGVNAGPDRAVRILQQTVGAIVDGKIGPQTVSYARREGDDPAILDEITARRLHYYGQLGHFGTFGLGWARRTVAARRAAEAIAVAG